MTEIFLFLGLAFVLVLLRHKIARLSLRQMIIVAIMAALGSVGRMAFAAIPSVQPATYLIIMTGLIFGPAGGFLCGIITGLLSSFLTSIGPWTAWQMTAWGLIGLFAGYLPRGKRFVAVVYGAICGFLFGWLMNLWFYTTGALPFTLPLYLAACVASFYFDLAHAATNAALLLVIPERVISKLLRADCGREK